VELPYEMAMTNAVEVPLFYTDIGNAWGGGGVLDYTLVCKSQAGDSVIAQTGTIRFSSINDVSHNNVYVIDATAPTPLVAKRPSGITLTESWTTYIYSATHLTDIKVTFTSNIGSATHPCTMRLYYFVHSNSNLMYWQY
jgi:hypothetical protein